MSTIFRLMLAALFLDLAAGSAQAESCTRSREYILSDTAAELPQQPSSYQTLFKVCLDTLMLSNVRDAFILIDGGIAVVPKADDLTSTANTLAQFCRRNPHSTLHFVTRGELAMTVNVGRAVKISSTGSTPCQKIMGGSS
jgi:hypothetical protein